MTENSNHLERQESMRVLQSYADPLLKDARACPFCDGTVFALTDWKEIVHTRHPFWRIYCVRCGTLGPVANTKQQAIDYWNRNFDKRILMDCAPK